MFLFTVTCKTEPITSISKNNRALNRMQVGTRLGTKYVGSGWVVKTKMRKSKLDTKLFQTYPSTTNYKVLRNDKHYYQSVKVYSCANRKPVKTKGKSCPTTV